MIWMMFTFLLLMLSLTLPITESLNQDVKNKQTNDTKFVAFNAELSADTEVTAGTTLVFDSVRQNIGGYYFENNGLFGCPDDGLYTFIWTVQKPSPTPVGMRCVTQLRKRGEDYKLGPKSSYYTTTLSGVHQMSTVLRCDTEPITAISVQALSWSETITTVIFRQIRTSFLGFRLESENTPSFSVELSEDKYLFPGSRIMFDRVIADFGDDYNVDHGYYECPEDGVYVFSVTSHTTDPNTPWSVMRWMRDREMVMMGPITYTTTQDYDSGVATNTVVLECTASQAIWLEAHPAHHFLYNSYSAGLTSFTGYKLYDAQSPNAVAFTAVMTQNHTNTMENHRFTFDQVITNIGNSFDVSLSQFVCPDDDYYIFTWSTAANYGGTDAHVYLQKDQVNVRHLYLTLQTTDDDSGTSGTATLSTMLQCSVNSRIDLKGVFINERIYLAHHTSFSGYKIPGQ